MHARTHTHAHTHTHTYMNALTVTDIQDTDVSPCSREDAENFGSPLTRGPFFHVQNNDCN